MISRCMQSVILRPCSAVTLRRFHAGVNDTLSDPDLIPLQKMVSKSVQRRSLGLLGLPNVGKSTTYNALTGTLAARMADFPFCTIDPQVGRVSPPDAILKDLSTLFPSANVIPLQFDIVDIAGLVEGASMGAGMGNAFLSHVRSCTGLCHCLKGYNADATGSRPFEELLRDMHVIEDELILADLSTVEKVLNKPKQDKQTITLLQRVQTKLEERHNLRQMLVNREEARILQSLQLLSAKPMLLCVNHGSYELRNQEACQQMRDWAQKDGRILLEIQARNMSDMLAFEGADKEEFAEMINFSMDDEIRFWNAFDQAIRTVLDISSFYTAGETEIRTWPINTGAYAAEAAGVIHTDMQKGFIAAEVVDVHEFIERKGSWASCRRDGQVRVEGRTYPMKATDLVLFRFNV